MAALRGAELIATSLDQGPAERDRAALALGSILSGYAIDSGHVRCSPRDLPDPCPHLRQPPRRDQRGDPPAGDGFHGAPSPRAARILAAAIKADLAEIEARILELGGDPPGLGSLGADRAKLDQAIDAILARPELAFTPEPPNREELSQLIASAW